MVAAPPTEPPQLTPAEIENLPFEYVGLARILSRGGPILPIPETADDKEHPDDEQ